MRPAIETASGREFDFTDPRPESINIEDIAHALSNLCRYTGHVREFYSVAQHSILVSRLVPPDVAMYGLLHDASEAYLGDVSSPLKQLLPEYRRIESVVQGAIYSKFDLHPAGAYDVKGADLIALVTEKRYLMPADVGAIWREFDHVEPDGAIIVPMRPPEAKAAFLLRFSELRWQHIGGAPRG